MTLVQCLTRYFGGSHQGPTPINHLYKSTVTALAQLMHGALQNNDGKITVDELPMIEQFSAAGQVTGQA